MTAKISAFVICFNEESCIRRCLESIKWCDEIVVVDSGSRDKTPEICREYTDKVLQRAWTGFVDQKSFALANCSGEWILNLDADEEVSEELKSEILAVISSNDGYHHGYELSRVVFYLNKWWRKGGWYPEYRVRLAKREHTSWGGEDPHEKAVVSGAVGRLKGELRHYTYADLQDQVRSLNLHSSSAARTLYLQGKKVSLPGIFLRAFSRQFKFYFLKKGFREGVPGVIVAFLEGYYAFLKYSKLWEFHYQKRTSSKSTDSEDYPQS